MTVFLIIRVSIIYIKPVAPVKIIFHATTTTHVSDSLKRAFSDFYTVSYYGLSHYLHIALQIAFK